MRFLFVSYAFPGPLGPMASWLASQAGNHVIFATSRSRQDHPLANVQRVVLKKYQGNGNGYLGLWEEAINAAKSASSSLEIVRNSGFVPHMVLNASSNGVAFGVREIFPDSFRVNFLEEENFARPGQIEMRRSLQILQTLESNLTYAFSEASRDLYPRPLWPRIGLAPRMVDSAFFSPEQAKPYKSAKFSRKPAELVTVFCNGNDPQCQEMCLRILQLRPKCRLALIMANSFALKKVSPSLESEHRLEMLASPRRDALRDLLACSCLAIFPDSGEGMLEAMSCGAAVMTTSKNCILSLNRDMLCLEGDDVAQRAQCAAQAIAGKAKLSRIAASARKLTLENFGASSVMPRYFPQIQNAYQDWRREMDSSGLTKAQGE